MNTSTVATDVAAVQGVAGTILATLEAVDPALAAPIETTQELLTLLAGLVTAALTALQNASGAPITPETVAALLPDADPLPLP